jgi:multiple sugar transport system substrate-binding protein
MMSPRVNLSILRFIRFQCYRVLADVLTARFQFKKYYHRVKKALRIINLPRPWVILAIAQVFILLLLLITWPRTVTLSLILPEAEVGIWRPLIETFETQNPDIRITPVLGNFTTDEVEAIYTTDFKNITPAYDLIYTDMIWVQQFAASGQLKDLTGLMPETELAQLLPEDIRVGQYQNGLYWLPLRSDVGVLFYRNDLLARVGYTRPPQTFEDLLEVSQRIQAQGLADWGYVWQGKQYEGLVAVFEEVLAGYGGYWIKQDTTDVGLDQPAALEAVKFLQRTIQQGISPTEVKSYDEEGSFREFAEGKTVFLRNWPFIQPRLDQSDQLRNRVQIASMVHAPGRSSTPCKGGWGFGISSRAAHPQEASRAIQFFMSEEAQRQLVLSSGYLPSRRSLFNDPVLLKAFPYLSDLYKAVENSVPRPLIPRYKDASDILQRYLSDALNIPLNGSISTDSQVKTLMQAAAEETRQLLNADVEA